MMCRRWGKVGYPTCTVSTSRAGNFTPSCSPRAEGTKHTHTHAHTRLARAFIMTHQDARAAAEHCTRQTRTWVTDLPSSRCALGKKKDMAAGSCSRDFNSQEYSYIGNSVLFLLLRFIICFKPEKSEPKIERRCSILENNC